MMKTTQNDEMMKKEKIPDLESISQEAKNTFEEIRNGLKTAELSQKDRNELMLEIENGMFIAYQFKVNQRLKELEATAPDTPVRDVMIKLLEMIPPDASASLASKVADYISKEWEKRQLKMAA